MNIARSFSVSCCLFLSGFCWVIGAGCAPRPASQMPELSFTAQVEAVRTGETTSIHLQTQAVSDAQLELLGELEALTKLQLEEGKITDAGLAKLSELPHIELLKLRHSPIGDDGLQKIANWQHLRVLNLPHAQFSDQGLAKLSSLQNLELLRFHSPHVTDSGLQQLAESGLELRFLHIIDVAITDAGLEHLIGMRSLESLYIDGGDLSRPAIERLFTARPDLHVHFNQQHYDFDPQRHAH